MTVTKPGPSWTPLGATILDTDGERVAAFAQALGQETRDSVPATFAATLLSAPTLMNAISAIARERGAAIVHLAQEFTYHRGLKRDMRYAVELEWQQDRKHEDRLAVRGLIRDYAGELLQEFRADIVFFDRNRASTSKGAQA